VAREADTLELLSILLAVSPNKSEETVKSRMLAATTLQRFKQSLVCDVS